MQPYIPTDYRNADGDSNKIGATFYDEPSFSGKGLFLPVGNYPYSKLLETGIKNDSISSIKINSGTKVTIYKHAIGQYPETQKINILTSSISDLSTIDMNNTISSVKIEKLPAKSVTETVTKGGSRNLLWIGLAALAAYFIFKKKKKGKK